MVIDKQCRILARQRVLLTREFFVIQIANPSLPFLIAGHFTYRIIADEFHFDMGLEEFRCAQ